MVFLTHDQLTFIFGLLGNIVSFSVFLAPIPTFYTIYKKKSSEGFQSIPYAVALMSALLLLYYGVLKTNAYLIISINSIGCAIEITYLIIYLIYASKKEQMLTLKLILFFNIGAFGLMMLLTILVVKGSSRVTVVGWICAAFSLAVFAAPLTIMRRVIRTKSVEYMPFSLSFSLTLNAIMWLLYGVFIKDYFIATPNVVGFFFGIAQMILYIIYKDAKKHVQKKTEQKDGTMDVKGNTTKNIEELYPVDDQDMEMNTFPCNCKPIKSNENNV